MSRKPSIELWQHAGMGLIIEYPSGVICSNQTGGTACLHPEVEGVFVPLRNDTLEETHSLISPENELYEYFVGPKHKGAGATSGLDSEDADKIQTVLAKHCLSPPIDIDRQRLKESHEAWVYVTISGDEDQAAPVFSGFEPYPRKGILTWSNSD